jgi:hypothetical protein
VRKKLTVAAATLIAAAATAVLAGSSASASPHHEGPRHCETTFDAAVHEDNDAYNARDEARYSAILNPRMLFWYDGSVTTGRDAIMANARRNFATPGWTWTYTILSETVYGCESGIAVLDTHNINPGAGTDKHYAVTMTLVREHGRWSVAIDNVHPLTD